MKITEDKSYSSYDYGPEECSQDNISQVENIIHTWDHICVQCCKIAIYNTIYNTVHITDYFQFIFSMLPQDFSNQPTKYDYLQSQLTNTQVMTAHSLLNTHSVSQTTTVLMRSLS